jgi:uncharacterized membrane protein YdjX (TVP38/TMEM64 family)
VLVSLGRVTAYLLVLAVVFGVNLLPALGPPTWAVLVWFRLHDHLFVPLLVVEGVLAACAGRFLLATVFGLLRGRVSRKTRENLGAARKVLQGSRGKAWTAFGLFVLSPVPSAQLFEAAGLIGAPLLPLTLAFGAGRLVTYSVYAGGASAAADTDFGRIITHELTSPVGLAVQGALLLGLFALTRIDWHRFVH